MEQDLSHRLAWELIPLVVNGSASAEERRRVDEHLRACADCRDELAFQMQLHDGMTAAAAAPHDPQPALRRLLERLDADEAAPAREAAAPGRRPPLLVVAVAGQAIALAVLGALLLGRPAGDVRGGAAPAADGRYRTLSTPAAHDAAATIRFVPAPTLTLGELKALLGEAGLRIVESSADNAVYGLAPSPADAEPSAAERERATREAVARLRARPGVLLAEPIAPAPDGAR